MTPPFTTDIIYLIAVPDWRPEEATPLQGFAPSLCINNFLIRAASLLPATIFEPSPNGRASLPARRLCGLDPVQWHPQSPRSLQSAPLPAELPFAVVMLGRGQDPTEYSDWKHTCQIPPTIVAEAGGDLTYADLTQERLQSRFLEVCELLLRFFDPNSVATVRDAIEAWNSGPTRSLGYTVGGHATVTPNLVALSVLGFGDMVHGRFDRISDGIGPYIEQIVATTNSLLAERGKIDTTVLDHTFARSPAVNLFAPALYEHGARLAPPPDLDRQQRRRFHSAVRLLARQAGYNYEARTDHQHAALMGVAAEQIKAGAKPAPHPLFAGRAAELSLATSCMEALAASELSATVRLPNEINRTITSVRLFADQYHRGPRRRLRAFREVQQRLADAVPPEFIDLIRASSDGIRIIADAHLEWLDIDGLPLGLRMNCSRIPVTPGNLLVEQLTPVPLFRLTPANFKDVLIISALKRADPIKKAFEIAFDGFSKEWGDALNVRFVEVGSAGELAGALNEFNGPFVIFDGHGSHRRDAPAVLHLQDVECDVWQLRGQINNPPPIVLLSACDTHAVDRNHATTANGFLSLQARSVMASVFPLNAVDAAMFAARLMYRVAEFVPAAVRSFGRAVTWTEVVSGMLRMQLLTDFMRQLLRKGIIDDARYFDLHSRGNAAINGLAEDPFAEILTMLGTLGLNTQSMRQELEAAIANSSAISYLHMGRPETIMLDLEGRMRSAKEFWAELETQAAREALAPSLKPPV